MTTRLKAALVAMSVLAVSGCYAEEVRPASPCAGGEWIRGHHGPSGRWHPGHWRCPGMREVIEID